MTRRQLSRAGVLASLLPAVFLGSAAPASAQAASCAEVGGGLASVSITQPAAGATVSGPVRVQGTAQASAGFSLSRVEISLGGAGRTLVYDPTPSLDFTVTLDTGDLDPGEKELRVVACNTSLAGVLVRGQDQVRVNVQPAPAPTTTAPRNSTTTTAPAAQAPGGARPAAQAGATPTTAAPVAGPTTSSPSPPSTEARVEVFKPEPVRPKTAGEAPLVLTETPASRSPRPPLWVGAVVGVSGALGLGFSAASWRRRSQLPETAEPVDPDLVEVG